MKLTPIYGSSIFRAPVEGRWENIRMNDYFFGITFYRFDSGQNPSLPCVKAINHSLSVDI